MLQTEEQPTAHKTEAHYHRI